MIDQGGRNLVIGAMALIRDMSAPPRILRPHAVSAGQLAELAELLAEAESPALVVGAPGEGRDGWDAVVALAERLRCPVWQEPFSRAVGFPQDHPQFAGHLAWQRRLMRDTWSRADQMYNDAESSPRAATR